MSEPTIPINGGESVLRADVAERHGIKRNEGVNYRWLMELRIEEAAARKRERGE